MIARPVSRDQRRWNKGLLVCQKKPLEPKHVWSIRARLEIGRSWRDLVIFNLAIDSKLELLRHFDHALERRGLSYALIFIAGRRTLARG
jgi:hypothetical protein